MNATTLRPIIDKLAKGTFFTAINVKKNGEMRKYICRLGVKSHLNGGELPYDPDDKNILTVWDSVKKEYRAINVGTLNFLQVRKNVLIKDGFPTDRFFELLQSKQNETNKRNNNCS